MPSLGALYACRLTPSKVIFNSSAVRQPILCRWISKPAASSLTGLCGSMPAAAQTSSSTPKSTARWCWVRNIPEWHAVIPWAERNLLRFPLPLCCVNSALNVGRIPMPRAGRRPDPARQPRDGPTVAQICRSMQRPVDQYDPSSPLDPHGMAGSSHRLASGAGCPRL